MKVKTPKPKYAINIKLTYDEAVLMYEVINDWLSLDETNRFASEAQRELVRNLSAHIDTIC